MRNYNIFVVGCVLNCTLLVTALQSQQSSRKSLEEYSKEFGTLVYGAHNPDMPSPWDIVDAKAEEKRLRSDSMYVEYPCSFLCKKFALKEMACCAKKVCSECLIQVIKQKIGTCPLCSQVLNYEHDGWTTCIICMESDSDTFSPCCVVGFCRICWHRSTSLAQDGNCPHCNMPDWQWRRRLSRKTE